MPLGRIPAHLPGFVAADKPLDCGACIAHHGKQRDFPPLDAEHVEAWNLFLLLQDQQRIGMEPIGLDYVALPAVFELEEIPRSRRRELFRSIVILNHALQAHRATERDVKNQGKAR